MTIVQAPANLAYADTFRALGYYLDHALYRDVNLVESPLGLLVKGQALGDPWRRAWREAHSEFFTLQHLAALRQEASYRRNLPVAPEARVPSVTIGEDSVRYEDTLRAAGHFIDRAGWRDIIVIQTADCLYIKGQASGAFGEPVTCTLDARALADLATGLRLQRGKHTPHLVLSTN
jgi:hypothetical protein